MTISEAAYLVIMSSLIAERGMIYMLKMGEAVKIDDIARRMIKLSGNSVRNEDKDEGIEIIYTGLRPGEKLYEELLVDHKSKETSHEKIFCDASEKVIPEQELAKLLQDIENAIEEDSIESVKEVAVRYADYQS